MLKCVGPTKPPATRPKMAILLPLLLPQDAMAIGQRTLLTPAISCLHGWTRPQPQNENVRPRKAPHRACSGSYQEGTYFGSRMRDICVTVDGGRQWLMHTPGQDSHRLNETASSPLSLPSCPSVHRRFSVSEKQSACGILISEAGSVFEGAGFTY